ncbi:hypothetical protein [Halorussus lipolyticus]|uniref:hypothetical protein n=1 Tax=Halorussus lipolyticus TaxID=3034024 RepID=UPI0023E82C30|nr:hypothetical protein [Halorussus sp. DT80]
MVALQPRRLIREGLPIAAILTFWNLLAVVASEQQVGGPVGAAGVVMAALYVLVRGVALSSEVLPPMTGDVKGVLYENASLAVPAGAWFLAGIATNALGELLFAYGPPSFVSTLASSLGGAGLGVVAIYAVAAGSRTLDTGRVDGRPPANRESESRDGTDGDGASADD